MLLFKLDGSSTTLPLTDDEKRSSNVYKICKKYSKEALNPKSNIAHPENDSYDRPKMFHFGWLPDCAIYLRDLDTQERLDGDVLVSSLDFQAYVCIENLNGYAQQNLDEIDELLAENGGFLLNQNLISTEHDNKDAVIFDDFQLMVDEWNFPRFKSVQRESSFVLPGFFIEDQSAVVKFLCYALGKDNEFGGSASYHAGHVFQDSHKVGFDRGYKEFAKNHIDINADDLKLIQAASDTDAFIDGVDADVEALEKLKYMDQQDIFPDGPGRLHVYKIRDGIEEMVMIKDTDFPLNYPGNPARNLPEEIIDEHHVYFLHPGQRVEHDDDFDTVRQGEHKIHLPIWDPRNLKLFEIVVRKERPLKREHFDQVLRTLDIFGAEADLQMNI